MGEVRVRRGDKQREGEIIEGKRGRERWKGTISMC